MTTQSIIVYRNPLEAAMWEGNFPNMIPLAAGAIAALTFFLLWQRYAEKLRIRNDLLLMDVPLTLSGIVWFGVSYFMWI